MGKRKFTAEEKAYIDRLMALGLNRTRARWYLNAMQTWTSEDYQAYAKFHLDMMGSEETEQNGSRRG